MSELGQLGINGPMLFDLARNSTMIASGAQFDVFQDRARVYKRIKVSDSSGLLSKATELRFHYRTIQLELASLCDPVRRKSPNIVQILGWGYDYFNGDTSSLIPFLEVQTALCSLESFLPGDKIESAGQKVADIHHHICLDVANGLQAVHASGLAHGDLKPSNVLIYLQKHSEVPFIAKLSDFAGDLKLRLKSLALNELASIPENRREVCADLLQCNVRSYHDWSSSRQYFHGLKDAANDSELLSVNEPYHGDMHQSLLDVLEGQFKDPILSLDFDHSTLFAMAFNVLWNKGVDFRARAALYFLEAARRSHIAAQAMMYRLLKAVPECGLEVSEDEITRWLFNGARTGSLVAMEDLLSISSNEAEKARKEFVRNGGYNQEMSLSYLEPFQTLVGSKALSNAFNIRDESLDKAGNRLIHYAATFGDTRLLALALRQGAQIDAVNDRGETALYKACLAGNVNVVHILADFGADAKVVIPGYGVSCLHWLFNFDEDKQATIAQLLVTMGADVSACSQGIERTAEGLHSIPLPWFHFPFVWPLGTPLHWATFARRPSTCDILLSLGSHVNHLDVPQDQKYNTAFTSISVAAFNGDSRMLGHLLSRSADPSAQTGQTHDAIHLLASSASSYGHTRKFPLALKHWILHGSWEAHLSELTTCVKLLMDSGVDLNSPTTGSSSIHCLTPIGEASTFDTTNGGALIALLRGGAQAKCSASYEHRSLLLVWCSTKMGGDNMELSYRQEFAEATESILEHTADFHHTTTHGDGILHRLCAASTAENFGYLVSRILSQGPELLEARNDSGETPLLVAASNCHTTDYNSDVTIGLDILLDHKADILAKSSDAVGFLSMICFNIRLSDSACHKLAQRYLRAIDSHPEPVSHELTLALQNASSTLKPKVVRLLAPLVTNINSLGRFGRNAFDQALLSAHHLRLMKLDEWIQRRIILRDQRNGLCYITRFDASPGILQSTSKFLQNEKGVERLFDDDSPTSISSHLVSDQMYGVQRQQETIFSIRDWFFCAAFVLLRPLCQTTDSIDRLFEENEDRLDDDIWEPSPVEHVTIRWLRVVGWIDNENNVQVELGNTLFDPDSKYFETPEPPPMKIETLGLRYTLPSSHLQWTCITPARMDIITQPCFPEDGRPMSELQLRRLEHHKLPAMPPFVRPAALDFLQRFRWPRELSILDVQTISRKGKIKQI
ncbi:uncharacterized protein KY384_006661 [Bacidia gigantensis]|uniref:uncharacterized protein n=1 Tax=Bacidia gigantensis TaxID=2732470 RepID=UPI001D04B8B3|nr:uncharacterized protein KY384_006661 [Bacidia gigantensis]KAG8528972.1 hypothetical protein KY384_006661 [Bacidia gigantensis]